METADKRRYIAVECSFRRLGLKMPCKYVISRRMIGDPDNLIFLYSLSAFLNGKRNGTVVGGPGEIVNASVLVYNDVIRLINNWRFIAGRRKSIRP